MEHVSFHRRRRREGCASRRRDVTARSSINDTKLVLRALEHHEDRRASKPRRPRGGPGSLSPGHGARTRTPRAGFVGPHRVAGSTKITSGGRQTPRMRGTCVFICSKKRTGVDALCALSGRDAVRPRSRGVCPQRMPDVRRESGRVLQRRDRCLGTAHRRSRGGRGEPIDRPKASRAHLSRERRRR
jgi:hypothetical protein